MRCADGLSAAGVAAAGVTAVAGLGAVFAPPPVMVTTHQRTTVHTPKQSGKESCLPICLCPAPSVLLLNRPHQFPDLHGHQRLMRPLHSYPLALRLVHLLVDLVGHIAGLVLHHVADIDLVLEDGLHRLRLPVAALFADVGLALAQVVEAAGGRHLLRVQGRGDFSVTAPLAPKVKNAPDDGGGSRVDYQNMLVLRAFQIADGGVAAHILPGLERGAFHRFDLAAGVPGVEVVHDIFQNYQHLIVFVSGVHPVIEGDEPAAEARKNDVYLPLSI